MAAKAEAKATLAGKAEAQSAGRGMGGGVGPQGTLRPAKPAPEATRRWVHCGWDADYYDKAVALAAPGELIEAVMQDANGDARGCLLVEVIGAPSQLNSQNCPWEEGCVFPVRFIACEDAGISDWAAVEPPSLARWHGSEGTGQRSGCQGRGQGSPCQESQGSERGPWHGRRNWATGHPSARQARAGGHEKK